METVPQLPLQLLSHIAVIDHGKCYREMLAIPLFARFAIKNRKWLYIQMTKKSIHVKRHMFDHSIEYTLFGKLHREDGPALIWDNGDNEWYKHGKLHRDEDNPWTQDEMSCSPWYTKTKNGIGPAVENKLIKEWYKDGKEHREDGPAVVARWGLKEWYWNGIRHRVGGAALIIKDKIGNKSESRQWFRNGLTHREDGPAVIHPDGTEYYYLDGKNFNEEEFLKMAKK